MSYVIGLSDKHVEAEQPRTLYLVSVGIQRNWGPSVDL